MTYYFDAPEYWDRLRQHADAVIERLNQRPHYKRTRQADFGGIIRARLAGAPYRVIACRFGVSTSRVGQIVHKALRMAQHPQYRQSD